ncbi:hypothetical protein Bca4012_005578 [Brassica carinata]
MEPLSPPPITWPNGGTLTNEWVHSLMSSLEWSSWNFPPSHLPSVMPVNVFDSLILTAKIVHRERNCVHLDDLDSESTVIVVGDIHERHAGFPSQNRFYVFNGDYVDRGAWGLETFLILFSWKLGSKKRGPQRLGPHCQARYLACTAFCWYLYKKVLMPDRVFLLRGNHESKYFCTSMYGFEKEVLTKYGDKGKHVYLKCLGCFEGLPLASVISGRVYTAHGGLGKKNPLVLRQEPELSSLKLGTLEELMQARRSVLDPPWEGSNLIPGDRGIGLLWGPDCTEEFLSHEGPDAREKRSGLAGTDLGYTIDHDVQSGKLITIFSAPDYPQFQATRERYRNKGAYIILQAPDLSDPQFRSFEAVTPRPKANPYYDFENEMDKSAMDSNEEQAASH